MVQEITTKSWGSRILGALFGIIAGIALIIGAFCLIGWNEGHALHTAQSLQQASAVVVSVPNTPIDEKNNMHVVYFSGEATTDDVLKDSLFNVSEKALQLHRQVEMYQWQENVETTTEKKVGGSEQETKTYTYENVWSTQLIPSDKFKEQAGHKNPSTMPLKSTTQYAKKVTVGDFKLPLDLVKQIDESTAVSLDKTDLPALKSKFNKDVKQQGDGLYVGNNSDSPEVGDLRITISAVLPQVVSVLAQQTGSTVEPYMAPAGQPVSLIEVGQVSPQQMIHDAAMQNKMMTWIWRLVSLAMMIFGFALIMNPIAVLADVIPFVGSLVGAGIGLVSFVIGLCLWAIAIAIAWFAVRPLWAIGLIIFAVAVSYLLYRRKKHKGK